MLGENNGTDTTKRQMKLADFKEESFNLTQAELKAEDSS